LRDRQGCPVIVYAIENDQVKAVKFLLENGANANLKTVMGDTALFFAVINGNMDITNLLINSKVNINEKNNLGETALMQASFQGYTDLAKILLEKGAAVNARDKEQSNAIMRAALKGYNDIVLLLLKKGANPLTKDIKSKSAKDYALEKGNRDTVTLFEDWQKNPKKTLSKFKTIHINAPNGVIGYKLLELESNKEISKGTLEIKKVNVQKMNALIDKEEYAEQRTFNLFDDFIIGQSNYGHKDREKIGGFGMWLKRLNSNVFSWEWYEQENDNVFKKLQGEGKVRVEFRKRNGCFEISKITFIGDQIFRARKTNLLTLLTSPNKEDWHCIISDGSYIVY